VVLQLRGWVRSGIVPTPPRILSEAPPQASVSITKKMPSLVLCKADALKFSARPQ
jgi:hypothetical protein